MGAGSSSVGSVPPFEAVGRRIDPSQWTHLPFGKMAAILLKYYIGIS